METIREQLVINLMVESEETLAALYRSYSYVYDDKDIWEELAKEELIHAQWIIALRNNQTEVSFENDAFDPQPIQTMISSINEKMNEPEKPTLLNALSISLAFEKSMIEMNYFGIFRADTPATERVMQSLRKSTEEHIHMIEHEIDRIKVAQNLI